MLDWLVGTKITVKQKISQEFNKLDSYKISQKFYTQDSFIITVLRKNNNKYVKGNYSTITWLYTKNVYTRWKKQNEKSYFF